jgi:hypothetical protein
VALFLTAAASAGADPSTDGSGKDVQNLRVTLGLQGAMFQADPERKQEVYVLLDTECSGSGAWQRIWGIAPQISAAFVDGVVRSGTVTGEKLEMEVLLHVPRDGWT